MYNIKSALYKALLNISLIITLIPKIFDYQGVDKYFVRIIYYVSVITLIFSIFKWDLVNLGINKYLNYTLTILLIIGFSCFYKLNSTWQYFMYCLCIGLYEELIFRFLIYHKNLKENFGYYQSMIISALIFGVIHGLIPIIKGYHLETYIYQIIIACYIGIILALILDNSKSLIICIVFHAGFNYFLSTNEIASPIEKVDKYMLGEPIDYQHIFYYLLFFIALSAITLWYFGNKPKEGNVEQY